MPSYDTIIISTIEMRAAILPVHLERISRKGEYKMMPMKRHAAR